MIKAEIIADSVSIVGKRLTSFVLEYPRFIHAELMTHRVFSRNASSSRAIPIEKMIQQVIDNPAIPEHWGKNQSGMQAHAELDNTVRSTGDYLWGYLPEYKEHYQGSASGIGNLRTYKLTDLERAKVTWLEARDAAVQYVKRLNKIGLHKQIANRILEPWLHIRIILSATEFENWFALRAHPDAQPEIRILAERMLELYNQSTPKKLATGEWHIPFGDRIDEARLRQIPYRHDLTYEGEVEQNKIKIAIARCARVSYFNFEGKDDYEADIKLCDRLFGSVPRHLSPTEHVAQSTGDFEWHGNFQGFKQYRKLFLDENLKDPRVIIKQ